MLMIYCVYIIVIHDWMYLRNIMNILCLDVAIIVCISYYLIKCKQTLQIATFNVRTLNRIGQLPELIASAEEHMIDIICIQEHRYTHSEDIKYHETGNGWSLATVSAWKNSVNAAVGGVGLLIGPRALKTLNSVEKIQPRMVAATFNGNPRATIISCHQC